jgi:hypothetical protein
MGRVAEVDRWLGVIRVSADFVVKQTKTEV